jgi:hypothetical protein
MDDRGRNQGGRSISSSARAARYTSCKAPSGGVSVTSVSVAGNYILWGSCFTELAEA